MPVEFWRVESFEFCFDRILDIQCWATASVLILLNLMLNGVSISTLIHVWCSDHLELYFDRFCLLCLVLGVLVLICFGLFLSF